MIRLNLKRVMSFYVGIVTLTNHSLRCVFIWIHGYLAYLIHICLDKLCNFHTHLLRPRNAWDQNTWALFVGLENLVGHVG